MEGSLDLPLAPCAYLSLALSCIIGWPMVDMGSGGRYLTNSGIVKGVTDAAVSGGDQSCGTG